MTESVASSCCSGNTGVLKIAAIVLLAGAVGCLGYSGYWFLSANGATNQLQNSVRARQLPANQQAAGMEMMLGAMTGMGAFGMDIAAVAGILEMEKYGWKYLSFALILGFGGYQLLSYSRSQRISDVPPRNSIVTS